MIKKTLKYMHMLGKVLNSFRVSTYEQISVLHYFLYTLYLEEALCIGGKLYLLGGSVIYWDE